MSAKVGENILKNLLELSMSNSIMQQIQKNGTDGEKFIHSFQIETDCDMEFEKYCKAEQFSKLVSFVCNFKL